MKNALENTVNASHASGATRIAFAHHKGGTGKTTSCLNVAGWLARMGKNVLVVDLDPQGNATAGLGVDRASCDATVADLLLGRGRTEETVFETSCGVYLLPASPELLVLESHLAGRPGNMAILRTRLDVLAPYFDFILLDVPPGSTELMTWGVVAADNLVIAMDSGVFALEALDTFKTLVVGVSREAGIELNIMMILLREHPNSVSYWELGRQSMGLLRDFLSANRITHVRIMPVPFSRKICSSQLRGLPISHHAPSSGVGRAFRRIAREITSYR